MLKLLLLLLLFGAVVSSASIRSKTKENSRHLGWLFGKNRKSVTERKDQRELCSSEECKLIAKVIKRGMDDLVDPCDDFYEYACGNWANNNPAPENRTEWNLWEMVEENVEKQVNGLLNFEEDENDSYVMKLAKKWYNACMDEERIEKEGLQPLLSTVTLFGGWPIILEDGEWDDDVYTWQNVDDHYARLTTMFAFFDISVGIDDYNETDPTIILDDPMFFGFSRETLGLDDDDDNDDDEDDDDHENPPGGEEDSDESDENDDDDDDDEDNSDIFSSEEDDDDDSTDDSEYDSDYELKKTKVHKRKMQNKLSHKQKKNKVHKIDRKEKRSEKVSHKYKTSEKKKKMEKVKRKEIKTEKHNKKHKHRNIFERKFGEILKGRLKKQHLGKTKIGHYKTMGTKEKESKKIEKRIEGRNEKNEKSNEDETEEDEMSNDVGNDSTNKSDEDKKNDSKNDSKNDTEDDKDDDNEKDNDISDGDKDDEDNEQDNDDDKDKSDDNGDDKDNSDDDKDDDDEDKDDDDEDDEDDDDEDDNDDDEEDDDSDEEEAENALELIRNSTIAIVLEFAKAKGVQVPLKRVEQDVDDLIEFQIDLFIISRMTRSNHRTMTLQSLQEEYDSLSSPTKTGKINFVRKIHNLFAEAGVELEKDPRVDTRVWKYIKLLRELLDETPSRTLVNYVHWNYLNKMLLASTKKMQDLMFSMYGIGEVKEMKRSEICKSQVEMTDIVGYEYARRYLPDEVAQTASDMIDDIQKEVEYQIKESTWMNDKTKHYILDKLVEMDKIVGYPDWYRNTTAVKEYYKGLPIGPSFYENILTFLRYERRRSLRQVLENNDVPITYIDPRIINAFFYPPENFLAVTVADLQSPFFNYKRPWNVNFGLIGFVMAHEVNHGFDPSGRFYDRKGKYMEWLSKMAKEYNKRSQCFVDQFNGYSASNHGNLSIENYGNQTVDENIADTMGLQTVFRAYRRRQRECEKPDAALPGLEHLNNDQVFFLSFANLWCESKAEDPNRIKYDEHSTGRLRVLGSVSNSNDFAKAFKCPVGSPMNPEIKCNIWK